MVFDPDSILGEIIIALVIGVAGIVVGILATPVLIPTFASVARFVAGLWAASTAVALVMVAALGATMPVRGRRRMVQRRSRR